MYSLLLIVAPESAGHWHMLMTAVVIVATVADECVLSRCCSDGRVVYTPVKLINVVANTVMTTRACVEMHGTRVRAATFSYMSGINGVE